MQLLLTFIIGLATGFFDSTISAGGLISVSSLILIGLPPQIAIATDRFGTIGQTLAAGWNFWKAKKIIWKYVPIFTLISLIGSLIGAEILLNINPKILQSMVAILLFILLPLLFLKQEVGVEKVDVGRGKMVVGLILYFLISVFAGFFGAGTGPMIFYVLTFFFGLTMIETLAVSIIPWFVISISSIGIFALNQMINYWVGAILLIGMAIGGWVGAKVAIKKGDRWVKRLFIVFIIVLAVKLLFFK